MEYTTTGDETMERKKWKRADQAMYDVKERGRDGFEILLD